MRGFGLFLLIGGLLALSPVRAAPFLAESVDIPLMPGLAEKTGDRLLFDAPEGRIFETVLEGDVDLAAARAYYRESLEALGWEPQKTKAQDALTTLAFAREKERLVLVFERAAARLSLHISLTPK